MPRTLVAESEGENADDGPGRAPATGPPETGGQGAKCFKMRKRLLFLAYPFPPNRASGAVRAWYAAKHLARIGWDVTVVTVSPEGLASPAERDEAEERCRREGIAVLKAGRALVRPSAELRTQPLAWMRYAVRTARYRALRPLGISHDEGWLFACLRRCQGLRKGDFDVILATGCPYSTFIAANRLSRRLGIPYVLDYRDPWTLSAFKRRFLGPFARGVESTVLRHAAASVIVSGRLADNQARGFGMSKPPTVIGNGFSPEDLADVRPMAFSGFAVVYAGTFYEGQRTIDPLLRAVRAAAELVGEHGAPIRLHVFGPDQVQVLRSATALGVQHLVVGHGRVPRQEALSAIKGAGATAVIASIHDQASPAELGIVTGKIFEPLGMGVPILLLAPENSEATDIVERCGAGRSFRPSHIGEMGRWLADLAMGSLKISYEPPSEHSWPILAASYDTLLRSCVEMTHPSREGDNRGSDVDAAM